MAPAGSADPHHPVALLDNRVGAARNQLPALRDRRPVSDNRRLAVEGPAQPLAGKCALEDRVELDAVVHQFEKGRGRGAAAYPPSVVGSFQALPEFSVHSRPVFFCCWRRTTIVPAEPQPIRAGKMSPQQVACRQRLTRPAREQCGETVSDSHSTDDVRGASLAPREPLSAAATRSLQQDHDDRRYPGDARQGQRRS